MDHYYNLQTSWICIRIIRSHHKKNPNQPVFSMDCQKGAHCAAGFALAAWIKGGFFCASDSNWFDINKQRTTRKIPSYSPKWTMSGCESFIQQFYQNVYRMYIIISFNPMQRGTITALPYSKLGHFFGDKCAVICDHCTKKSWNLILYHPIWNLLCIQISRPTMAAAFFSNVTRSLQIGCFHLGGEKKHLVGWFPVGIALPYQLLWNGPFWESILINQ